MISFYKFQNTRFLNSNFTATEPKITGNNTNKRPNVLLNTNILTTNIHIFYIILFLTKFNNTNNKLHKQNKINCNVISNYIISFFFTPITKKNTIFLRAPYKNKLARLNILKRTHKFTITIKQNVHPLDLKLESEFNDFLTFVKAINLSSFKIKHIKTRIKLPFKNCLNYNKNLFN